ncbi:MAG TPA: hypothetical protein VNX65_03610 [Patescibacteria group bacterium]|jgi:hypothetical protein|nr:hypothetical protein [Patescibacteria group bacterium]
MKRRDFIWAIGFMVATAAFSIYVTSLALLNRPPITLDFLRNLGLSRTFTTAQCGMGQKLIGLEGSSEPHLKKLAEYQQVCGTNPASRLMVFTDMPNSDSVAVDNATKMAKTLKDMAGAGVKALVVLEPVTNWGAVDFNEYRNGFYDVWLDTYFKTLKQSGITDEQMGMWVPFPEANLPYWNHQNSKPDDFAANVTKTVILQKKYFPNSKASVMLNSATYANDDFDWRRGEYISLVPYLKTIPKGLIDSFGYQGLPWAPPSNQPGVGVMDANEYLNTKIAIESANQLGVKSIWLNTGTFGRKYTLDPEKTVVFTAEQRKDILAGVQTQAKTLRDQGYSVAVNLFAEDKSGTQEATDWSYWANGQPKKSPDSVIFADFVSDLHREHIDFWLFDQIHDR